jgi:AcrR family transcriptional regulator
VPKRETAAPQDTATARILKAASSVFAERGFGGARVDEIARRAKVNKAMLYYHVGDKAALYEAVLQQVLSGAWREIEQAAGPERPPEERLRGVVRAVSSMAASTPDYPRLFLRELAIGGANLPASVLKGMARIGGLVRSILEEGRRAGSFRPADPLMTHLALVGSIMALSVSAPIRKKLLAQDIEVVTGNAYTQEIPDFLGDLVLGGLRARETERAGELESRRAGEKRINAGLARRGDRRDER